MHEDTVFSPTAFEDFTYWAQNDRKILGKIKAFIADIHRNGLNVLRGYTVSGRDCEPEDHSAYI